MFGRLPPAMLKRSSPRAARDLRRLLLLSPRPTGTTHVDTPVATGYYSRAPRARRRTPGVNRNTSSSPALSSSTSDDPAALRPLICTVCDRPGQPVQPVAVAGWPVGRLLVGVS